MPQLFTIEIQYGTRENEPDWRIETGPWVEGAPYDWTAQQVADRAVRDHAEARAALGKPDGQHFRAVVWIGKTRGLFGSMQSDPNAEAYSDGATEGGVTVESEPLTSLADMADAAWQSVRSGGFGAPILQATKVLRDMDGKRQELKVYLRECQDSIRRAHAEAVEFDEAATARKTAVKATIGRKAGTSDAEQIRAADLTIDHIHRVISGLGTAGGDLGMVHGLIVWITFTEDSVRVGVCDRPDSGAHDVEFSHSDPITIEAGK